MCVSCTEPEREQERDAGSRRLLIMSEFIGPALPPHLKRRSQTSPDENRESDKVTGSRREKNDSVIELSLIPPSSKSRSSIESVDDLLVSSAKKGSGIGPLIPYHHSNQSSGESSEDNSESDSTIGPLLPSHLIITKSSHCSQEQTYEVQADIGPSFPPHLCSKLLHHSDKNESSDALPLGPSLPPHLSLKLPVCKKEGCGDDKNTSSVQDKRRESEEDDGSILVLTANSSDEEFCEDKVYGPALPPGLKTPTALGSSPPPRFKGAPVKVAGPALPPGILGPLLPPGFKVAEASPETEALNLTQPLGGLEHGSSSESEDDVVGPVPEGKNNFIQEQLEMRAMQMRRSFAGDDKSDDGVPKRETWMLELPPERAAEFGLGPRQFRARARMDPGDRTVWTDTPDDRERKKHCKVEVDVGSSEQLKQRALKFRDISMQQEADRHANKREEKSLLDSHQELLKKKRKKDKESGKQLERRPFDRDTDLHTNRFDEAQKKSIFNKARLLNDRFSSGQSKFL